MSRSHDWRGADDDRIVSEVDAMDFYRGAGMSVSCLSQQFRRRLGCPGRRKLAFQYHLSGRRDRKAGKVHHRLLLRARRESSQRNHSLDFPQAHP